MSTLSVEILDVAFGGDGVARHDGKVIFIPGTLAGETVEVKITKSSKRFSRALPVNIISRSDDRIENDCPYSLHPSADCSESSFCAGCAYRHSSYAAEAAIKKKQLEDLLLRIAHIENIPPVDITAAETPGRYRNKITLHVPADGKPGYFTADNSTIISISDCKLANSDISAAVKAIKPGEFKPDSDIIIRFTQANGVMLWNSPAPGKPLLTESTYAGDLSTPPSSFTQINPEMSCKMTQYIQELIADMNPENMIDLYCGTGIFAICAAAAGIPNVFGVEIDQAAVDCAAANAKRIAPGHANFICSDALSGLKTVLSALGELRNSVVLVDPPRKGIHPKLLAQLKKVAPNSLIYVSCAPDKLARDTKELAAGGYVLESLRIFDMFPRTASFETVAVFRKTV